MKRTYIFVGERRSALAVERGWTWKDGRLAACTLFDALLHAKVDPLWQTYVNLFADGDGPLVAVPAVVQQLLLCGVMGEKVVGMGRHVQSELARWGVPFAAMIHPAARGKIRKRETYRKHVKNVLKGADDADAG